MVVCSYLGKAFWISRKNKNWSSCWVCVLLDHPWAALAPIADSVGFMKAYGYGIRPGIDDFCFSRKFKLLLRIFPYAKWSIFQIQKDVQCILLKYQLCNFLHDLKWKNIHYGMPICRASFRTFTGRVPKTICRERGHISERVPKTIVGIWGTFQDGCQAPITQKWPL